MPTQLRRLAAGVRRIQHTIRMPIITLVLLAPLVLPGFAGAAQSAPGQPPVMLGIWQPPAPGDLRPLHELEAAIGRQVDIVPWYQAWGSEDNSQFRTEAVREVHAHGAIPMITWEPWDTSEGMHQPEFALSRIPEGAFEAYIWDWAKQAAAIDGPILLRFAHEMNGNWYPWAIGVNGTTTESYKAAWRHIVGIFRAAGAGNVQFVWSPNKDYPGATPLAAIYPGDDLVDWVAIDGYNFGPAKEGQQWRDFNQTFKATYDQLVSFSDKPVMIAETGSAEAGGDKAAWIRNGLNPANLVTNYPELEAIIWFNQRGSGNWPITTSDTTFQAFAETVQSWLNAGAFQSGQ